MQSLRELAAALVLKWNGGMERLVHDFRIADTARDGGNCRVGTLLCGIDGSRLPRQSPDLGQLDRSHVVGCGITCCGGIAVGIAVGLKGRLHVAQHVGEERIAVA